MRDGLRFLLSASLEWEGKIIAGVGQALHVLDDLLVHSFVNYAFVEREDMLVVVVGEDFINTFRDSFSSHLDKLLTIVVVQLHCIGICWSLNLTATVIQVLYHVLEELQKLVDVIILAPSWECW